MRCKNCGAENDDSRFICENCGSPLYDENEEIIDDNDEFYQDGNGPQNNNDDDYDKKKKRNIIIISIVAAVIVIAIIVGLVFAFVGKDDSDKETESISETILQTEEDTTKKKITTTRKETTTESTTKETTTKETTTKETTTKATTLPSFYVSVDIDGNGSIAGDGTFTSGKKATLIATADEGYQFVGWYDNSTGALVASSNKYTVTVKKDINLTAKFAPVEVN